MDGPFPFINYPGPIRDSGIGIDFLPAPGPVADTGTFHSSYRTYPEENWNPKHTFALYFTFCPYEPGPYGRFFQIFKRD